MNFESNDLLFGVALQAPNIDYPPHVHPAIEFYYTTGGTAAWRRGDEAHLPRAPGRWIFHDRDVFHATRTGREPMLALYAWVSDLDSESVIEVPWPDCAATAGGAG